MGDPILSSLRIDSTGSRLYEVTGLRTTSIRDQMLRAELLVERLFQAQMLGPGKKLLVIGGGAGGVTATMAAGELDIDVTLCEAKSHFFSRQATSNRFVDPTEYDWPQPHWEHGIHPWQPFGASLPYVAGNAHSTALQWNGRFARWLKTPHGKNATANLRTPVHKSDVDIQQTHIGLQGPRFPTRPQFDVAVSFAGFLREKCSVPDKAAVPFRGFPYWSVDPYDIPDMNLHVSPISVLVSGAGDGALQDFLRIATGLSAKDCCKVFEAVGITGAPLLAVADDLARRAHAWRASAKPLHQTLQTWHDVYAKAAEAAWLSLTAPQRDQLSRDLPRANVIPRLLLSCSHTDYAFSLNRWLVLLVGHVLAHAHHAPTDAFITKNTKLVRVDAKDGHVCGNAARCHGKLHVAHGATSACAKPTGTSFELGEYHCIIVRHGLEVYRMFGTPSVAEHIVPFAAPR